jgi:glycosyltransferase involved in cell wall biosynthesis
LTLSVIIFCYNEAESLEILVRQVLDTISSVASGFEIIIVNDGSTDATKEVAEKIVVTTAANIRLVNHAANLGIGMALFTGYSQAKYDYVCAIPGDGQFDVALLKEIKPFNDTSYYSFYRTETDYNRYRKLLTWGNRFFNQHILGVFLRDVNWIKVYRKTQLDLVQPKLRSSLIESEICAKLHKCKVLPIEIPSLYLRRKFDKPKGGAWKTVRKVMMEIPPLWWQIITFKGRDLRALDRSINQNNISEFEKTY